MVLSLLLNVAALLFGLLAIRTWRRDGFPVARNLGFVSAPMAALDFCAGVLIAGAVMVGIYVVEHRLGATQLAFITPNFAAIAGVLALLTFAAALEEFLFRSFLLNGLVVLLRGRRVVAVILSAIVFGAIHLSNPHASYVTAFGNALGGVMYCVAFLGARSFWLPLGLHFAWNFVQGPVLGFAVSGVHFDGFATQHTTGDTLLTGGDYGPEGGLVGMGSRFVIIAATLAYLAVRPKAQTIVE